MSKIDLDSIIKERGQLIKEVRFYSGIKCRECNKDELYCKCEKIVPVYKKHLLDLLYWARRYCDGRSTYAASHFNDIYRYIAKDEKVIPGDILDDTLRHKGKYWPYAQDGMYDEKTGAYDATR